MSIVVELDCLWNRGATVALAVWVAGCGPDADAWVGDVAMIEEDADGDGVVGLRIVDSRTGDAVIVETEAGVQSRVIAWSPDGGSIAYLGDVGEEPADTYDESLRSVDPRQDRLLAEVRLSSATVEDTRELTWSPAGDVLSLGVRVYFPVGLYSNGDAGILVHVGGADAELHQTLDFRTPSWSPDGSRLVAVRRDQLGVDEEYNPIYGDSGLVFIDTTGKSEGFSVSTGDDESHPAWSPDGEWIAFVRDTNDGRETYVASVAGGVERQLVIDDCEDDQPQWFPDSRRLLVTCERGLVEVDASGEAIAVHPGPAARLSPDGDRLLGFGEDGLEARDLDGSHRVDLGAGSSPVWRPLAK